MLLARMSILLLTCQVFRLPFSNALPTKMALIIGYGRGYDDFEYIERAGMSSQIIKYLPGTIDDFTAPASDADLSYRGFLFGNLQLNPIVSPYINTPNLHSIFTNNKIPTNHAGLWNYTNSPDTYNYTITYDPNKTIEASLDFIRRNENYFTVIFMPLVDISYIPNVEIYPKTKCIGNLPQHQTYCGGQIYQSSVIYEDYLVGVLLEELTAQNAFVVWTTVHGGLDSHVHTNSEPRTSFRGKAGSLYDGGIRTRLRYSSGAYGQAMRNDGNGIDFFKSFAFLAGINGPITQGINLFDKTAERVTPLEWAVFKRAAGHCLNTSPAQAKQVVISDKKYKVMKDRNRTEVYPWNAAAYNSGYEYQQVDINITVPNEVNYTLPGCRPITPSKITRKNKKRSEIKRVIVIMGDDMGWGDYSFRSQHPIGNNYPNTPHIDKLAKQGVVFNRYYAASSCSPSRTAFEAARKNLHKDVQVFNVYSDLEYIPPADGVPPYLGYNKKMTFLGKSLQQQGIKTGHFGKSHIANLGTKTLTYYGYDDFKCFECTAPASQKYDQFLWTFPGTSSEVIVNDSLVWMDQQLANNSNFFIKIWFKNSHVQINALPGQVEAMGYGNEKNPSLISGTSKFAQASALQTFNALVHEQDLQVARIVHWVTKNKLTDSTAIIYLTDNGDELQPAEDNSVGDPGFRGGKRSLYQGGINVPGIFWAPGLGIRGETNTLASVTDWYPTIYGLFGFDITQVHDYRRFDGKNLLPCLLDNDCAETDNRTLLFESRIQMGTGDCTDISPRFAIVKGRYKLLLDSGLKLPPSKILQFSRIELYDLYNDPIESQNIASQMPEIVAEYTESLRSYKYYANAYYLEDMEAHKGSPVDKRLRVGFRCN